MVTAAQLGGAFPWGPWERGGAGCRGAEVVRGAEVYVYAWGSAQASPGPGSHGSHGNPFLDALHPVLLTTQYKWAASLPSPGNFGHWNSASGLPHQRSRD